MRIHHIALVTRDPVGLAAFYAGTLDLREIRRNDDDAGVRSVWLDAGGTILMFERGEGRGWDGVMFATEPGSRARWAARFGDAGDGGTAYTLYARDPDGNRFGVSSYPDPL
jgi:glyoxylase I family protein